MLFKQLALEETHLAVGGSACSCLAQPHSAEENFTLDCGPTPLPITRRVSRANTLRLYMIIGQCSRQG